MNARMINEDRARMLGDLSPAALCDPLTRENLQKFIDHAVEAVNPVAIYVFGSRAKGTAKADSDLDLMVVVKDNGVDETEAFRVIQKGPVFWPIDLVVVRESEFRRRSKILTTVENQATTHGFPVYAAQ